MLKGISEKEKWDLKDVKITELDLKSAKIGTIRRYEFRVKFGRGEVVFKLFDKVSPWESFGRSQDGSDFEASVREISSKAVLESFKIQGPFHLRVDGDSKLNLILPRNASVAGMKHIIVREGITVEVNGAEEVSLIHTDHVHKSVERRSYGYLWPSLCMALLPVRLVGSATLIAYQTRRPEAYIQINFPSERTIELLLPKCYSSHVYKNGASSTDFLNTRLAILDKVLQSFLGHNTNQRTDSRTVHAKIEPSSLFRLKLEVERKIHSNDSYWSTLADWRTKPTVERLWYEVVARVEAEVMKPLTLKQVKPFVEVDTKDWGSMLSNVSFTKFPSILVPQESLTLDVKW